MHQPATNSDLEAAIQHAGDQLTVNLAVLLLVSVLAIAAMLPWA